MARAYKPRKRTRNDNILIVIGLLVAISMVFSGFVVMFMQP